jgi:hypothetical protein
LTPSVTRFRQLRAEAAVSALGDDALKSTARQVILDMVRIGL